MEIIQSTPQTTIAKLNDRFRQGDHSLGKICTTQAVNSLPSADQQELFRLLRTFNDFTPGNDPYGEHDFGSIEFQGETYFFKIDYYDKSLRYGTEDPSDPAKTTRVLTLMHSREY